MVSQVLCPSTFFWPFSFLDSELADDEYAELFGDSDFTEEMLVDLYKIETIQGSKLPVCIFQIPIAYFI